MRAGLVLAGITLTILVGCNANQLKEPIPSTHKAGGIVILADGKPFTKGGTISFQHDDETKRGVTTSAAIKSDGEFELTSVTARHSLPGAQEGSYRVTILPNSPDQSAMPIQLDKKYVVKVGDNRLTVKIEK